MTSHDGSGSLTTPGRIVTFYSYKGGTGRSMALANVAWILASQRQRVLVIDWDLEAPGLHRYFQPFVHDKELTSSPGVIDFFTEFNEGARDPKRDLDERNGRWFDRYTSLEPFTFSLDWEFPAPGTLDFVPAGLQGGGYGVRVTSFDWQSFYKDLGGGVFLEAVKARLRSEYDWILIDSRTGISDSSGICTVQMPDDLVVLFTLNNQSIFGASAATESAFSQRLRPNGEPGLRIWPVPTRVELAEKERLEAARDAARESFQKYLMHLPRRDRQDYWGRVEVPYDPYFAYEEVLATFADRRRTKLSILAAMEALTERLSDGQIHELAAISEQTRVETLAKFTRKKRTQDRRDTGSIPEIFLSYGSEDAQLAAWLCARLSARLEGRARIVWDRDLVRPGDRWREVLLRAVEGATAFLFLLTPERLKRGRTGMSDDELDHALKRKVRIIPVLAGVEASELAQSRFASLAEFWGTSFIPGQTDDVVYLAADLLRLLEVSVTTVPEEPQDPEDPQLGRWGGSPSRNNRTLSAVVRPAAASASWFQIDLRVSGTPDVPLVGEVAFHLHPTFKPAVRRREVQAGIASMNLTAWGAFTVGVVADNGQTKLELNLADLSDAPGLFRER